MPRIGLIGLIVLVAQFVPAPLDGQGVSRLGVVVDVGDDGTAGALWLAMLRSRLSDSAYSTIVDVKQPLTDPEHRWMQLIRARASEWAGEIESLAMSYAPIRAPSSVTIVLGNRGGEDAFVHDRRTIGFDLAALERNYGGAGLPENAARIDRFFRHEYVHLLQKAWLEAHPAASATPIDRALADIWAEGLGNFYSLSSRWRVAGGGLTNHARRTLATLEPRFVARLAALTCASPAVAASLTADLSAGPFAEKWGALPAALWLAAEEADSAGALRRFVVTGPPGVWALAERGIDPALSAVLHEVQAAAVRCDRPR
jgi:hypothetical protein